MNGVERKGIDGINDISIAVGSCLSVALECIFPGLRLGGILEPLDRDTALNAAGGIAGVVGHARHCTGEVSERRLALLPGLELGAAGAEELDDGVYVVDVDDAARHGNDNLAGATSESLRFAWKGNRNGVAGRVIEVVQVESAVPRRRDEDAVRSAVYNAANGSGVLAQGS